MPLVAILSIDTNTCGSHAESHTRDAALWDTTQMDGELYRGAIPPLLSDHVSCFSKQWLHENDPIIILPLTEQPAVGTDTATPLSLSLCQNGSLRSRRAASQGPHC